MSYCKKAEEHSFAIDTPTFFDEQKPEIEAYYKPQIDAILLGTDVWFYKRTEVFTHLKCEYCQKEEHVSLPATYLEKIMVDPSFRFGVQTIKRLQVSVGGETYTYNIPLSTAKTLSN